MNGFFFRTYIHPNDASNHKVAVSNNSYQKAYVALKSSRLSPSYNNMLDNKCMLSIALKI